VHKNTSIASIILACILSRDRSVPWSLDGQLSNIDYG